MRQSGKDRAFAGLVRAYAATTGNSLRTAQRHVVASHPDWTRFVQGQAVQAVRPPSASTPIQVAALATMSPVQPPPSGDLPKSDDSALSEPEKVLRACHAMWAHHFSAWKSCMGGKDRAGNTIPRDDAMALSHAAACVKLRDSYERALQKFTQHEIEQRRLIPVNEFAAMRSEFVIPLRNLLTNLPSELAVAVNPADPAFALARISEFLQNRLQPAIHRLISGLDAYSIPSVLLEFDESEITLVMEAIQWGAVDPSRALEIKEKFKRVLVARGQRKQAA